MAAFEYRALDGRGKEKKGILEADTAKQVRQLLRDQKLTPLESCQLLKMINKFEVKKRHY